MSATFTLEPCLFKVLPPPYLRVSVLCLVSRVSAVTEYFHHITDELRPRRGFILPEILVLAGLGFQLSRVSAGGVIVY